MHAFSEQMVKPLIKKIWKGNERSSNSLFEPQRIVLNLKESSTPDRHLHRHLYLHRPGGDTKPVHVTGDMEKYLTTEGTKNGLGGFNKHDLIAATTMKGAPIHYLNPTELSWIWRKPQRQIGVCNIIGSNPIGELCRFFLWTLMVTLRLFFLYFAKTFEHLKERRPSAGHVCTKGGVGWSDSPLPWKVSWSLFISLCFSVNVTAWFNNQAYHAIAVSLAAADAGILRSVLGKNVSMTTVNHPLPRTVQESINDLQR